MATLPDKNRQVPVPPNEKSFLRKVFMALLLAGFFVLFVYALKFFMLVFGGILLGIYFGSVAEFLQKRTGIKRVFTLAFTILFTLGIIVSLIWFMAPTLYHQGDEIIKAVGSSIEKIRDKLNEQPWGNKILNNVEGVEGQVMSPDRYWSRFKGVFSTTLRVLADVLIILITGIFLSTDPKLYVGGVIRLVSPVHRPRAAEILDMCYRNVRLWLLGKFAGMIILGVLFYAGLMILDIPLAFSLAIISAFLAFIPNIGGYLSGVISVLVAFTVSPQMAVYVLILYVGIQFLEDYFLTPVINKRMIHLPPALTLFWLVLLGLSAGILGLFLAAPLLSVVLILIREIYIKDHLEAPSSKGQGGSIY